MTTQLDRFIIGSTAIFAGITLLYLAILGPLGTEQIIYSTSQSAKYQIIGQDLVNILLLAPLCIIGGIACLLNYNWAKYLLILTPLYLLYMGFSYGVGVEWNTNYAGNSYKYFFFYAYLIVASLILMISTIPQFSSIDVPTFHRKSLQKYLLIFVISLTLFAKMWIDEVIQVILYGDTLSGSYSNAPTLFWVIRYLDLGITIPIGYIAAYLLWYHLENAYAIIQLAFGFFITMATTVNCMAYVMLLSHKAQKCTLSINFSTMCDKNL